MKRFSWVLFILILYLINSTIFSCSSSEDNTNPVAGEDSTLDTVNLNMQDLDNVKKKELYVVLTDYSTGLLFKIIEDTSLSGFSYGIKLSGDPIGYRIDSLLIILNRNMESPATLMKFKIKGDTLSEIEELSLSNYNNPYDLDIYNNTLIIPMYNKGEIAFYRMDDMSLMDTISLVYNFNPDPDHGFVYGDYYYITLQNLNDTTWVSEKPSEILKIDLKTLKVVDTIQLPINNPVSDFIEYDNKYYFICVGSYLLGGDGGILRFDPQTDSVEIVYKDDENNSINVKFLDIDAEGNIYTIVGNWTSTGFSGRIAKISDGKLNVITSLDYSITSLKLFDSYIITGGTDSEGNSGIYIFDLNGILKAYIKTELPVYNYVKNL